MKQPITIISDPSYVTSSWYNEIITSIRDTATKAHNRIQIYSAKTEQIAWHALPEVVLVTNGSLPYVNHTLSTLERAGKKVILAGLDSDPFGSSISCVTPSRRLEISMLMHYYRSHGFQRIALVGFRQDGINDMIRYHAAFSIAAADEFPFSSENVFFWETDIAQCLQAFTQQWARFDAVICPNDAFAICFINHCRQARIDVPGALLVSSFSDMLLGKLIQPSLTTISMDFAAIGTQSYHAWEFINAHRDANLSIRVRVPSRLIVRESTRNLPDTISLETSYDIPGVIAQDDFHDQFYESEDIQALIQLEKCLSNRDNIDKEIISCLFEGISYEMISQLLYVSMSSLRYRVNKIYRDAGVTKRAEFLAQYRKYVGNRNPFPGPQRYG